MINILKYIFIEAGMIIPLTVYIMGYIIRHYINFIPNNLIPLIGCLIGVIMSLTQPNILLQYNMLEQICMGIMLGVAPTGVYELIRNTKLIFKVNKIIKRVD